MDKEKFDAMFTDFKPVTLELDNNDYVALLTSLTSKQFVDENRPQINHFYYRGVKITTNRADNALKQYLGRGALYYDDIRPMNGNN